MRLSRVLAKYKWRFSLTLLLVVLDAIGLILFPLFIGYTIDGALEKDYTGALWLGLLGLTSLIVGAGRRWFDSRFYARVYQELGWEVCSQMNTGTSTKNARLGFLSEVVEFFENSLPDIINNSIGLVGMLAILAALDIRIFTGCLLILLIVGIVYGLSEKRTIRINAAYNIELERQVSVIAENDPKQFRGHLKRVMNWNVRLSDLEVINFSIVWLVMMVFLVFSIVGIAGEGALQYGSVLALILYLFQFMESVSMMPIFYQQWLRLTEISTRLRAL